MMTRRKWGRRLAVLVLCGWALQVLAMPDQTARREIDYLLNRLETSGCQFFRNGDWFDAPRARRHLEQKYNWLVRRNQVASAEQFIERAATKSSRSGIAYQVRCPGSLAVPSAIWLTDKLILLRSRGVQQ